MWPSVGKYCISRGMLCNRKWRKGENALLFFTENGARCVLCCCLQQQALLTRLAELDDGQVTLLAICYYSTTQNTDLTPQTHAVAHSYPVQQGRHTPQVQYSTYTSRFLMHTHSSDIHTSKIGHSNRLCCAFPNKTRCVFSSENTSYPTA